MAVELGPTAAAEAVLDADLSDFDGDSSRQDAGQLSARSAHALESNDRRAERRQRGVVKWGLERGVPDVGGLGWRSRAGHVLKNQTYYATQPKENLWDNPTHAGPKTWMAYHGPRLRTDAPLMEQMDRIEAQQADFEASKAFVNTVRVQTLDRLYHQKVENGQREMASQWAPHRRPRREVNKHFDCFTDELDSMPVKELKKVLTPMVLHNDREAVRNIAKRIQVEETWKTAWKQSEQQRRQDVRSGHAHRMAFNDMLMELSSQPSFRRSQPDRRLPNNCTSRVEELAQPTAAASPRDLMKHPDFRGLIHTDNQHAIEARDPGVGHRLCVTFMEQASAGVEAGWPPPPPPLTPDVQPRVTNAATSGSLTSRDAIRTCPAPLPKSVLEGTTTREHDALWLHASEQFQRTAAPPAPEQRRSMIKEPLAPDVVHMGISPREESVVGTSSRRQSQQGPSKESIAPPQRPMVYPVVVPTVEAEMERPNWQPKVRRASTLSVDSRRPTGVDTSTEVVSARSGRWPPINTQAIDVTIFAAGGLPKADRSGHSDPYATCQIPGKAKSKAKTKVAGDTEDPVWNQPLVVTGWKQGEPLEFGVFDYDIVGAHDKLAALQLPSDQFYPQGFEGCLPLENLWRPEGRISEELKRYNLAAKPTIRIKVAVRDELSKEAPPQPQRATDGFLMPDARPTMQGVSQHLDDFESKMQPVPSKGNFWMDDRTARLASKAAMKIPSTGGATAPHPKYVGTWQRPSTT